MMVGRARRVGKQQHGGVERRRRSRKKKKRRNPEPGRAASELRTSENPARAGEGSTQTPGPTQPRHTPSVVYAPSEAIAMQHGGRCRRYRLSSSCCCCCCGRRRYCYCRSSPNGTATACDSADTVERRSRVVVVVVHSGKSTMTGHRQRRRPGFTRATIATKTAPSSSPRQII
ncbi:unnamed protein product [Aphis gossypii]|uniref:Uncharacterized protein n=1 Tax=Aphis gossypii TaxID=80765 RepID=A0A9P0IKQ4_APHGO|nr:unnamed protein product [Aphis gossypii]